MKTTTKIHLRSGQWTGFLNSPGDPRKTFDVLLEFNNNHITGVGSDENGMFVLSGDYDAPGEECRWVQTYVFGTTVFYRGFCENRKIWGTWRGSDDEHGGFEIRLTSPRIHSTSRG